MSRDREIGIALGQLLESPRNEQAWASLYKSLWPSIVVSFGGLVGFEDAQDIAQMTMIQIAERVLGNKDREFLQHMVSSPEEFLWWARAVARNKARDSMRTSRRWLSLDTTELPASKEDVAGDVEKQILASQYHETVADLLKDLSTRGRGFRALIEMASDSGCQDSTEVYLWMRDVLTDSRTPNRTSLIAELGRRLQLEANATYQQIFRLKNQLEGVEEQFFPRSP